MDRAAPRVGRLAVTCDGLGGAPGGGSSRGDVGEYRGRHPRRRPGAWSHQPGPRPAGIRWCARPHRPGRRGARRSRSTRPRRLASAGSCRASSRPAWDASSLSNLKNRGRGQSRAHHMGGARASPRPRSATLGSGDGRCAEVVARRPRWPWCGRVGRTLALLGLSGGLGGALMPSGRNPLAVCAVVDPPGWSGLGSRSHPGGHRRARLSAPARPVRRVPRRPIGQPVAGAFPLDPCPEIERSDQF